MQGFNIPQTYTDYPFRHSYYQSSLYYYRFCQQAALQNFNSSYNQYLPYYYSQPPNQRYRPLSPPAPDSNTYEQHRAHQILEENFNHRDTRFLPHKSEIAQKIVRNNCTQQGKQKENRNVYSNILRSFFRKIYEDHNTRSLVQSIIEKQHLSLTSDNFFEHLKRLKINYGKYLRFKKLRLLFLNEKFPEHSKIFRTLLEHFKRGQHLSHTLTSRKISRWSVILHLKGGRQLKQKLLY